jgi:hypothetical protein
VNITNRRMTGENVLIQYAKRTEVEAIVTYFKIISRYSSGGTQINYEIFHMIHVMTENQNERIPNERQKAISP